MRQFLLQSWPLLLCVGMMFFMHRPGAGHGHGAAHTQNRTTAARTVNVGRKFRRISVVKNKQNLS